MSDPYEQAARARRAPAVQEFLDAFVEAFDIEQDFVDASAHPPHCRCEKCLSWWTHMGPDPETEDFGPFSREEVEEYCKDNGKEIWW